MNNVWNVWSMQHTREQCMQSEWRKVERREPICIYNMTTRECVCVCFCVWIKFTVKQMKTFSKTFKPVTPALVVTGKTLQICFTFYFSSYSLAQQPLSVKACPIPLLGWVILFLWATVSSTHGGQGSYGLELKMGMLFRHTNWRLHNGDTSSNNAIHTSSG